MSVPQLRFKGFEGHWVEKKIGEITQKVGSGSTPRGGEEVYQSSGIPFIRSQNVNEDRLLLDDITYITDEINSRMQGSVVRPNDILLNITGASIGRSCVVPKNFVTGNVNQHVCIIRADKDYAPRFLQPYLSSSRGQKSILSTSVGSGREGLNFEAIRSFKVFFPQLTEQTKIANFLTAVDEKIAQLTQKCELLAQYKKGVMQQIFSQQLPFKDDDGREFPAWEETNIGKVLTIGSGKDYKHLSAGEIPVYGTGGYMLSVDNFLYDGESVCIGRKGTIDKPVLLSGKFWTVDTLFYTHSFKNCLPKFIYAYFQTIDWKNHNEASGVPSLSKSTIERIAIQIPCVAEQTKIANFLTTIDAKIASAQAQLEAAKQYKQGLLQQMFV